MSTHQALGWVLAIAIVFALAPVAVNAAGTLMSIVDNDSNTDLARVDSGKLRVGDGSGVLTVDGRVGVATTAASARVQITGIGAERAGPFTAGQKVAVTTVNLAGFADTAATFLTIRTAYSTSADCSTFDPASNTAATGAIASAVGFNSNSVTFDPPLVIARPDAPVQGWCLLMGHGSSTQSQLVGFVFT